MFYSYINIPAWLLLFIIPFLHFFYSYLTSMCNSLVMTDLSQFPPFMLSAPGPKTEDPFLFLHFSIISPPLLDRYRLTFKLLADRSIIINQSTNNYLILQQGVPLIPSSWMPVEHITIAGVESLDLYSPDKGGLGGCR